jgi:hypothetical protein
VSPLVATAARNGERLRGRACSPVAAPPVAGALLGDVLGVAFDPVFDPVFDAVLDPVLPCAGGVVAPAWTAGADAAGGTACVPACGEAVCCVPDAVGICSTYCEMAGGAASAACVTTTDTTITEQKTIPRRTAAGCV